MTDEMTGRVVLRDASDYFKKACDLRYVGEMDDWSGFGTTFVGSTYDLKIAFEL